MEDIEQELTKAGNSIARVTCSANTHSLSWSGTSTFCFGRAASIVVLTCINSWKSMQNRSYVAMFSPLKFLQFQSKFKQVKCKFNFTEHCLHCKHMVTLLYKCEHKFVLSLMCICKINITADWLAMSLPITISQKLWCVIFIGKLIDRSQRANVLSGVRGDPSGWRGICYKLSR